MSETIKHQNVNKSLKVKDGFSNVKFIVGLRGIDISKPQPEHLLKRLARAMPTVFEYADKTPIPELPATKDTKSK